MGAINWIVDCQELGVNLADLATDLSKTGKDVFIYDVLGEWPGTQKVGALLPALILSPPMQSATAECASSSSSTASSRRSSFSLAEFYQLVQSALDHPASGFPDQLALSLAPVPEHISSPDAPLALVQASSPSFPTNNNTPTSEPPLPAIPLTSHSSFRTTDRGPRRRINIQSRASSASLRPRQMFDRIRKNALSLVHPRTNSTHAPAVRDNAGSPTPPAKEHFHPIPTVSLLASSKNSIYSLNRGDDDDDDADSDFIPYLPLAVQYERAHPHAFSRAPNGSTTSLVRHHSTRSSRLRSSSPTTSTSSGSRTPPASPSHSLDERHSLDSVSTATEPHSPATPRTPQFFTPSHSASSHCDEHLGTARAYSPSVVSVDTSSHSHNPVNPNQPPNPGRWSIGPAEAEGVAGAESASQEEDPFAKGSVQIINYYYTPRHPYATASAGADPSPSAGCSAQQVVKRTNFSSPPRKRSRNKNARKEAARKSEPPLLPPPSVPLPDVPGPRTSIGSGVSSAENGSRVGSCSSESTCEWTLRLAVSEGDMRRAGGGGEKIVENSKTSPIILGDTEREKDVSVESEEITRTQSSARGCGSSKSTPPSPGLLTVPVLDSYSHSSSTSGSPTKQAAKKNEPPDWTLSLPILAISIPAGVGVPRDRTGSSSRSRHHSHSRSGEREREREKEKEKKARSKSRSRSRSESPSKALETPTPLPSASTSKPLTPERAVKEEDPTPTPTPTATILKPARRQESPGASGSSTPTPGIGLGIGLGRPPAISLPTPPPTHPPNYVRPLHSSLLTTSPRVYPPPAPLRCVPLSRPPRADTRKVVFKNVPPLSSSSSPSSCGSREGGRVRVASAGSMVSVDSGICMSDGVAMKGKGREKTNEPVADYAATGANTNDNARTRTISEGSMGIQERREIMNIRERQMERKRLGIGRRGGRAPWDLTGDRGKPVLQPMPVVFLPPPGGGGGSRSGRRSRVPGLRVSRERVNRADEEEEQEEREVEDDERTERMSVHDATRTVDVALDQVEEPEKTNVEEQVEEVRVMPEDVSRNETPEGEILHKDDKPQTGGLSLCDLEKACEVLLVEHRRSIADAEELERMAREAGGMGLQGGGGGDAAVWGGLRVKSSVETLKKAPRSSGENSNKEIRRSRTEETLRSYWSSDDEDEEDDDDDGGSSDTPRAGQVGFARGLGLGLGPAAVGEDLYDQETEDENVVYYSARSSLSWAHEIAF